MIIPRFILCFCNQGTSFLTSAAFLSVLTLSKRWCTIKNTLQKPCACVSIAPWPLHSSLRTISITSYTMHFSLRTSVWPTSLDLWPLTQLCPFCLRDLKLTKRAKLLFPELTSLRVFDLHQPKQISISPPNPLSLTIVVVIVNSEFLKRYTKPKLRAPVSLRARLSVGGSYQGCHLTIWIRLLWKPEGG